MINKKSIYFFIKTFIESFLCINNTQSAQAASGIRHVACSQEGKILYGQTCTISNVLKIYKNRN